MFRFILLHIDDKSTPTSFSKVVFPVRVRDICEVQRELIPSARVKHDISVVVFETIYVMVRIAPVIRRRRSHLHISPTSREDSKQRLSFRVFANELG